MRLELELGIFQIRLELATFGCNSPNQPTRITHTVERRLSELSKTRDGSDK